MAKLNSWQCEIREITPRQRNRGEIYQYQHLRAHLTEIYLLKSRNQPIAIRAINGREIIRNVQRASYRMQKKYKQWYDVRHFMVLLLKTFQACHLLIIYAQRHIMQFCLEWHI